MIYLARKATAWSATATFLDATGAPVALGAPTCTAWLATSSGVRVRDLTAAVGASPGTVAVSDASGTAAWPRDTRLFLHVEASVGGTVHRMTPPLEVTVVGGTSETCLAEMSDVIGSPGMTSAGQLASGGSPAAAASGGDTTRPFIEVSSSSYTLPDYDATIYTMAAFTITLNLPAASVANKGRRYSLINSATPTVTLHRSGTDQINAIASDFTYYTPTGSWVELSCWCTGSGWLVFSLGGA